MTVDSCAQANELLQRLSEALKKENAANDRLLIVYPPVALRLNQLLSDEDYGMRDVAEVVASDAVIAATVLRFANTVGYAAADEITRLDFAISRIGVQGVVNLVFASGLARQFDRPGFLLSLRHRVWRQALFSAFIGRQLCQTTAIDQEIAFIASLLQSIGRILVISSVEKHLKTEVNPPSLSIAAWTALVNQHSRDFGRRAALEWNLPRVYRDVIVAPDAAPTDGDEITESSEAETLVDICRQSDRISALIDGQIMVSAQLFEDEIGLTKTDAASVIHATSAIATWAQMLGLPSPFANDHSLIHPSDAPVETRRLESPLNSNVAGSSTAGMYALTHLGHSRLNVLGKNFQQPGSLVHVTVSHPEHPVDFWASVESAVPAQRQHELGLRPMLLTNEHLAELSAIIEQDATLKGSR